MGLQLVSDIDTSIEKISVDFCQLSQHRSGPALSRTATPNQYSYSTLGSPALSAKQSTTDHIPLSLKNSPVSYASPLINQRLPPQVPISDSPSISVPSLTNPTYPHQINQAPYGIKPDSHSLRSEDSIASSEETPHLIAYPPQSTTGRGLESSSSPNPKHRPPHVYAPTSPGGNLITHLNKTTSFSTGTTISSVAGVPFDRVPSPSPSLLSEREREENERLERELESKRKRLQIYVFICRCVACPFNSKQSSDMARKHLKVTLVQYGVIKERFLAFLNGKTHIEADEGKSSTTNN